MFTAYYLCSYLRTKFAGQKEGASQKCDKGEGVGLWIHIGT